jgi:plastocyanin
MERADADTVSRRDVLGTAIGGLATAATAGQAAAQEDGGGGGGSETVAVGPDGEFVFTPGTDQALEITPGTTVNFVWESDTHNIVVESQPDGANWEGHDPIENTGFEYSHTFETLGTYEYFCQPHKATGMVGTIEVVESLDSGSEGGGGSFVPDAAKTLSIATFTAMAATLVLAYGFLKFGGSTVRTE